MSSPIRTSDSASALTGALPPATRQRNPRGQGQVLRRQLIDAATRLLSELESVESLTLRAVAREVGITPASIYSHFANLEELVAHVIVEQYEELIDCTDRVLAPSFEPMSRVVGRAWVYARWAVANPGKYRVLFSVRVTDPEAHTPPLGRTAGIQLLDGLIADLRNSQGRGSQAGSTVSVEDEDRLRGLLLWAGLHGVVSLHIDRPDVGWPDLDRLLVTLVAIHAGVPEAEVVKRRPPEPIPSGADTEPSAPAVLGE